MNLTLEEFHKKMLRHTKLEKKFRVAQLQEMLLSEKEMIELERLRNIRVMVFDLTETPAVTPAPKDTVRVYDVTREGLAVESHK